MPLQTPSLSRIISAFATHYYASSACLLWMRIVSKWIDLGKGEAEQAKAHLNDEWFKMFECFWKELNSYCYFLN